MSHLLDTHTLLWALTEPEKLGADALQVLRDPHTAPHVFAVSAWEIGTKHRLGEIPRADVLVHGYARHLDQLGVVRLPITEEHALLAGRLDWEHKDPFDRMLAAQTMIESFTLLTADAVFDTLPGIAVRW